MGGNRNRRPAAGFSFIEVLIALGLLALTLISITSLFSSGQRQVHSGGTITEALAVARSILEEMEGWGYAQTYLSYGLDGTTTTATIDSRSNAFAAKWQTELEAKLAESHGEIEITSLETGGSVPALASSQGIRLLITIHWSEGQRQRAVSLAGLKL